MVVEAPPQEEKSGVAEQPQSDKAVAPQPIYRKDYKPTPYLIDQVHLTFRLGDGDDATRVLSELSFKPNHSSSSPPHLVLNGAPFHMLPSGRCVARARR